MVPRGIPPWPLSGTGRYRTLAALPQVEELRGLSVCRPRFPIIPALGGRFHPANIARAVLPLANRLHTEKPFDVIDASFFYPDGPAAMRIARRLAIPFSIKARGADIHHRSEEHTSELLSLMRISYAVFCLKKKKKFTITY